MKHRDVERLRRLSLYFWNMLREMSQLTRLTLILRKVA